MIILTVIFFPYKISKYCKNAVSMYNIICKYVNVC